VRYDINIIVFPLNDEVKQSFIADQRIDRSELKKSLSKLLEEKENTMNRAHMNPATRHNARLSRREEPRGAHFYLFRPVTHVAHSNLRAPTRFPEPAASRIVESFKIFMRHDPPPPFLVAFSSIVALEEGSCSSVTNWWMLKSREFVADEWKIAGQRLHKYSDKYK